MLSDFSSLLFSVFISAFGIFTNDVFGGTSSLVCPYEVEKLDFDELDFDDVSEKFLILSLKFFNLVDLDPKSCALPPRCSCFEEVRVTESLLEVPRPVGTEFDLLFEKKLVNLFVFVDSVPFFFSFFVPKNTLGVDANIEVIGIK